MSFKLERIECGKTKVIKNLIRNLKMETDISKRKGFISFSRRGINDYIIAYGYENPLFKDFVVKHIEYNSMTDVLKYCGYSKWFDEIESYCEIPEYTVLFHKVSRGQTYCEWVKK
jgi:hypothetical protein